MTNKFVPKPISEKVKDTAIHVLTKLKEKITGKKSKEPTTYERDKYRKY